MAIGKNPVIFPENSNSLFAGWKGTNVTEKITFNNIDTSTVNDMQWMFYYCGSLTSLDISSFKTDKVTDMSSMFAGTGYTAMTSLDLGPAFTKIPDGDLSEDGAGTHKAYEYIFA